MVDARERINADLREKLSRTGHSSASMGINSRIPDPRTVGFVGRISSTSADDLLQMDSVRRSYSAWDMNELRRRSPDRSLIIPRGISPPANMDELRRLQSMRSDTSRPLPFTNRAPMTFQPTRPVVRLASTAVVNGPKPSCPAAEHTVASLLRSLGLSKYAILFQAEEVDMAALRQMGDSDLKELGIPMGPGKGYCLLSTSHEILTRMRLLCNTNFAGVVNSIAMFLDQNAAFFSCILFTKLYIYRRFFKRQHIPLEYSELPC